jgi:hypothetical protein
MPPRRKRTTRKPASSRAAKPAPIPPVVGPGERLFVLSVPFEERGVANANGARWDSYTRQTIYVGAALPYGLTPYAAPDYSWERYVEDDLNGTVLPTQPSGMTFTPRPHQIEAIDKIEDTAARGYRGFLEADDVGLGKTISSWEGALRVARRRGSTNVLVMCPKGVIPHWRRTIAALGDNGLRVVVINYDQAKKLLTVPDSAASAARTRTKNKRIADSGNPVVDWDVVLYDESHKIKNQGSQRSKAAARIARYAAAAKSAPFVIWMSATAGQNPTELGYLAPLLSQITGAAKSDLKDFGQWLADEGFCVTYNARFKKWDWGLIPADAAPAEVAQIEAHKERDLARIRALLFDGTDSPSIRRLPTDIAGWPEIQRIAFPVDLDAGERMLYMFAWTSFRADMHLAAKGRDPKGGMAARLRFRQKASLIRVPGTVDWALDMIDNGHQPVISVEFHETSDAIREGLEKANVTVAEFSGRNTNTREQERLAFQRGQRQVMLFSVTEGISLHQGEALGDGTFATNTPRATMVHDPRYSGLDSIQIEGRAHRDGMAANVYYAFAAGTVEEQIVRTLVGRVLSTKSMAGDDVTAVKELEAVLDAAADANDAWAMPSAATSPTPSTAATTAAGTSASARKTTSAAPAAKTVAKQTPAGGRAPGLPVTRPASAGRATPRSSQAPRSAPRRSAPAAPTSSGGMTPEERALREALSGGKKATGKRRPTPEERAAFENRLRKG